MDCLQLSAAVQILRLWRTLIELGSRDAKRLSCTLESAPSCWSSPSLSSKSGRQKERCSRHRSTREGTLALEVLNTRRFLRLLPGAAELVRGGASRHAAAESVVALGGPAAAPLPSRLLATPSWQKAQMQISLPTQGSPRRRGGMAVKVSWKTQPRFPKRGRTSIGPTT